MLKSKVFAVVAILCSATVASAQATRTWVSGVGDDANPCSRTAPCKTFAGAISKTAAGGEIDALDPGGFGAVTITKAITIDGGPNAGGILNAGSNGVIINAGAADIVVLRNLSIAGAGSGLNGVRILQAGTVHIDNCAIYNQVQKGIEAIPTTPLKLLVKDSVIRDNTNGANGGGIFLLPGVGGSVTAYLNNVELSRNTFGIRAEANTKTSMRGCFISGNNTHGVVSVGTAGPVEFDLHNVTLSANTSSGLRSVNANSTVRFSNCMVNGNAIGLESVLSGKLISYTNNSIGGNTVDGAPTGTIAQQ
ncbi:MAG: right-handed parallel beta-helix repeat-containing protein [Planctomycetaceae bacterium]